MKYKTTAKELKEGYYHIISAGYCELQRLLKYKRPVAYASGVYGWNFDVYEINRCCCIATGYHGMPQKNTNASYALIQEYEKKAEGKTEKELDVLIAEFIEKAIRAYKNEKGGVK